MTPGSALTKLAGAWVLFVLVVPAGASWVAQLRHPVPSRAQYIDALRQAVDSANNDRDQRLERYLGDHPELVPNAADKAAVPYFATRLLANEAVEAKVAAMEQRFQAQLRAQEAACHALSWLSPALLVQVGLMRAAGTDAERQRDFGQQVNAYQMVLRDYFRPMLFINTLSSPGQFARNIAYPRFSYRDYRTRVFDPLLLAYWAFMALTVSVAAWLAVRRGLTPST